MDTMMRRSSQRCIAGFLMVWAILVLCGGSVMGQEVESPTSPDVVVEIEDYLDAMSNEQLIGMCNERGFGIVNDESELEHKDYVEAARRCLSMEDEMNAILAENPDLAAELETEILRMKDAKERLEEERDQMLAETAILKEQLKNAGVDISDTNSTLSQQPPPLSLEEVLRESLTELVERVASDARVVGAFRQPVVQPVLGALKMVAKHTGALPHLEAWKEKALPHLEIWKEKAGVGFAQFKVIAVAKYKEFQESGAPAPPNQAVA
jgi:hypothetical protein